MIRRFLAAAVLLALCVAPVGAQTRVKTLIPTTTLAAAGTYTGEVSLLPSGAKTLAIQTVFVRAAGGTTTKVYVQTSLDGGVTWVDIMQQAFATTTATKASAVKTDIAVAAGVTPSDGSMSDNTILDGVLGDRIRVKFIVAGTYTGASSVTVTGVVN